MKSPKEPVPVNVNFLRLSIDEAMRCLERIDEERNTLRILTESSGIKPILFKKAVSILHNGTEAEEAAKSVELQRLLEAIRG